MFRSRTTEKRPKIRTKARYKSASTSGVGLEPVYTKSINEEEVVEVKRTKKDIELLSKYNKQLDELAKLKVVSPSYIHITPLGEHKGIGAKQMKAALRSRTRDLTYRARLKPHRFFVDIYTNRMNVEMNPMLIIRNQDKKKKLFQYIPS